MTSMDIPSPQTENEPAYDAYYRLLSYVLRLQDEACTLNALIEGLTIIKDYIENLTITKDHKDGRNALGAIGAILTIARAKSLEIYIALDSVNLPSLDPLSAQFLASPAPQ